MPLYVSQCAALVKHHARRAQLIRHQPVDISTGRARVFRPCFHFGDAAVTIVNRRIRQDSNLARGEGRESDLPPHLVVAGNAPTCDRPPGRARDTCAR